MEICGIQMAVRSMEVIYSMWIRKCQIHGKLKAWIRKSLGLSDKIEFEYKAHSTPWERKQGGGPKSTQVGQSKPKPFLEKLPLKKNISVVEEVEDPAREIESSKHLEVSPEQAEPEEDDPEEPEEAEPEPEVEEEEVNINKEEEKVVE